MSEGIIKDTRRVRSYPPGRVFHEALARWAAVRQIAELEEALQDSFHSADPVAIFHGRSGLVRNSVHSARNCGDSSKLRPHSSDLWRSVASPEIGHVHCAVSMSWLNRTRHPRGGDGAAPRPPHTADVVVDGVYGRGWALGTADPRGPAMRQRARAAPQ